MSFPGFEPGYIVPRCEGEVAVIGFTVPRLTDDENIEQLAHELLTVVEHYGMSKVVLDLETVEFLTSSVLGKLITLHRRLHRSGGRLVLCGFRGDVAGVLKTSRLVDYFETADGVPSAVRLVGS